MKGIINYMPSKIEKVPRDVRSAKFGISVKGLISTNLTYANPTWDWARCQEG